MCEQRPADSTLLEVGSWKVVCSNTSNSSDALQRAWRRIPDSFQPPTNPRPSRWGLAGYRFRAMTPKALPASSVRSSLGSRKLQKWRTGCEGRISILKRRHGLRRSLYRGPPGERKSVEPMAARLAPHDVRRTHQSLHHLVAEAGGRCWFLLRTDNRTLATHRVRYSPPHADTRACACLHTAPRLAGAELLRPPQGGELLLEIVRHPSPEHPSPFTIASLRQVVEHRHFITQ